MYRQLGPGVDRFKAKDKDEQEEFRNALSGYVNLYAFLSQVMPFSDVDLEKLYAFGRHLELKLPKDDRNAPLNLDGEVALKYYRLDKLTEGQIALKVADPTPIHGPHALGTRQAKEAEVPLSQIIDVLNERFGTQFTNTDQLLLDQFVEDAKADPDVIERAMANPLDNFELAMKPKVEGLMIDRMDRNQEFVNQYINQPEFQAAAFKMLVERMYDEIRRAGSYGPPGEAP